MKINSVYKISDLPDGAMFKAMTGGEFYMRISDHDDRYIKCVYLNPYIKVEGLSRPTPEESKLQFIPRDNLVYLCKLPNIPAKPLVPVKKSSRWDDI